MRQSIAHRPGLSLVNEIVQNTGSMQDTISLKLRDVYVLPLACPTPIVEGGQNGELGRPAATIIGVGPAKSRRLMVGKTYHMSTAGDSLKGGAKGNIVPIWPGLSTRGHTDIDNVRLHLLYRLIVQAKPLHYTCSEVLNHYIGSLNQPQG